MLAEAAGFDGHLRALEREVEAVKAATESLLRTSRSVLASPLPRVFTRPPPGGPPAPVDAGAIGGDFDGDALAAASADAAHRLADNVLAPMERWRAGYATVDKQMARLEAMRLELDSRRHTTAGLAADLDKKRPALERAAGGKGAAKLDEVRRRGGRRGGRVDRARARAHGSALAHTHTRTLPPSPTPAVQAVAAQRGQGDGLPQPLPGGRRARLPTPGPTHRRRGMAQILCRRRAPLPGGRLRGRAARAGAHQADAGRAHAAVRGGGRGRGRPVREGGWGGGGPGCEAAAGVEAGGGGGHAVARARGAAAPPASTAAAPPARSDATVSCTRLK